MVIVVVIVIVIVVIVLIIVIVIVIAGSKLWRAFSLCPGGGSSSARAALQSQSDALPDRKHIISPP